MKNELSLPEKAQPCEFEEHPEGFKHFHEDDIERERLGWETREKALKQKIKEIADKLGDAEFAYWHDSNYRRDTLDKVIDSSIKELLGLSQ